MAMSVQQPRDALDAVFTRAQVEWALRRTLRAADALPKSLTMWLKHLLEFDRSEATKGPMAFSKDPPSDRGDHGLFSLLDAAALFTAVAALSMNFKRKEAVLMLRAVRKEFDRTLGGVLMHAYARGPTRGAPHEDFVLVIEPLPASSSKFPGIEYAKICVGADEVAAQIRRNIDQSRVLVAISNGVTILPHNLKAAPPARRGRSKP